MRIAIGSDHAGFALKQEVAATLAALGHEVVDVGTGSGEESVDYPDFAIPVAEQVAQGAVDRGVVVCATGIGASIAANKVAGARASVVTSAETARLTRGDNDSNILALGARTAPSAAEALAWMRVWLETPFAGGRHARRVDKITAYEAKHTRP
jgi:RpiB/LacA/LacB family sugar-phosphate isomerase